MVMAQDVARLICARFATLLMMSRMSVIRAPPASGQTCGRPSFGSITQEGENTRTVHLYWFSQNETFSGGM